MTLKPPTYNPLPWRDLQKSDCRWLESIVRNAAPFSDWWAKARIVQLAYDRPADFSDIKEKSRTSLPTYGGYDSEEAIADALQSICDPKEYCDFAQDIDKDYVIDVLNLWHQQKFNQAVSRNFEVYAHRQCPNIFLVTSTATPSLNIDRELPPADKFRPLFNVDELARIISKNNCDRLTLRTHGYNTPGKRFYKAFIQEINSLTANDPLDNSNSLKNNHFYLGFSWPSEVPLLSSSLWIDLFNNRRIFGKFLVVIGSLAVVFGTLIYALLRLIGLPILQGLNNISFLENIAWTNLIAALKIVGQWHWIALAALIFWLALMQVLQMFVYLRDRYRSIHYASPDLAEFFWRLDRGIDQQQKKTTKPESESELESANSQIRVNLIANSLGCLVLVNVLRILSDKFGKDELIETQKEQIGKYLSLDKLILCAADIPLEFLRESRNNYVRSAIIRCREIYLMSSDRDTVSRYISTVANWFIEPSLEMAGLRLGNVYLKRVKTAVKKDEFEPYIRIMISSLPADTSTSAEDLFEKFNYLDCSKMSAVNGIGWNLNDWTGVPIDFVNTILYFSGRIDVHGGFFAVDSPSFAVLKFLISQPQLSQAKTIEGIEKIIAGTSVLFLPSRSKYSNL